MAIKTKRILEFLKKKDLCCALRDMNRQVPHGAHSYLHVIWKLLQKRVPEHNTMYASYSAIERFVEQEAAARWCELQQKRSNYDKVHYQISKRCNQGTNLTLV